MTQIWHNPRCSKSRQTLALLTDNGQTPDIRLYLDDAPTADEIRHALALLKLENAIDLVRTGEKLFKELGLSKSDDNETLIDAMANNPKLIERPIVFAHDKAAIGRPPESVLDII